MFRFIHAADPHLDSPLQGLEAHEGAPVALLRGATRRAFENLVRLAIDERVDAVLIAGDVYDGDWKDYSTGLFFRSQMVKLREKRIPVFLIAGNHDAGSVISKKLSLPENVHVFSTRTAESKELPGGAVVVHGRGFPNRAVPENLAQDYPPAVPGKFNIGLLHTSLNGYPDHDTYAPCSETDLREKGYDYWALGHIHQPGIISRDPWIVFAGNCQGRHIKESGVRGCQLVSVSDTLKVERVDAYPLDVVRWKEIEVDFSGAGEEAQAWQRIDQAMQKVVDEADGRLVAARIILTGNTSLHGSLHLEGHRWRAEILARAGEQGEQALWVERIKILTSPIYDIGKLAARDPLTKVVVEDLAAANKEILTLPSDVSEMMATLPPDLREEVLAQWKEDQRPALLNEVRAIILEALQTKGEKTV